MAAVAPLLNTCMRHPVCQEAWAVDASLFGLGIASAILPEWLSEEKQGQYTKLSVGEAGTVHQVISGLIE
eukprot:1957291-Amphidinium_carterae.3